jgi:hypothetical protein
MQMVKILVLIFLVRQQKNNKNESFIFKHGLHQKVYNRDPMTTIIHGAVFVIVDESGTAICQPLFLRIGLTYKYQVN